MKEQWQQYCDKFLVLSAREKYMVIFAGFVVVLFLPFTFAIESQLADIETKQSQVKKLNQDIRNSQSLIADMELRLAQDPNLTVEREIEQYQKQIKSVDEKLLSLTSELIDPIAMRTALTSLLNMNKGVSLLSFEVKPATAINMAPTQQNNAEERQFTGLYKHEIAITLKGRYFNLRDYLNQLEGLKWTFFWQSFDYQLIEYPNGELELTMYSLSTQKEFVGV